MSLKIGDYIYYVDKHRDTIPCVVKAIKNGKALISAGFADRKYTRWVKLTNCELQEERK
jgi:hypothetical protein